MTEKSLRDMTPQEQAEEYRKMQEEYEAEAKWWKAKKEEYEAEKNYHFYCPFFTVVIKRLYEENHYEFEILRGYVKGAGAWVHKHSSVARWKDKKTIEIKDYFLAQMFNEECDLGGAMCVYDNN